jgi:phosphate transport system protein
LSEPLHLEESLQRDIDLIRAKVRDMSVLAEKALRSCLKSLIERNRQMAYAVILRDQYIDEMEKEVDRLCLEFIVRQQPVASVLRFAYATIKINSELERVGDYAESIARQILKLLDLDVRMPQERFREIAELSIAMLQEAMQAFLEQNAELARKTIETEEVIDGLKSRLNRDLVDLFRRNDLPFEALNPLITISRRFERVSDQARDVCMEVLYMCTGEYAKHAGAETFRVLFVDEDNACRSQVAEAIAQALNQPRFVFASAGLEPKPIASFTVDFMREKGLEISRQVPKAINQVFHLDQYHAIVALAPEAKRAFPRRPRKVVYLDWDVTDPLQVSGSTAEVRAALEEAYQSLQVRIQDLVEAILGQENP